MLVLRASPTPGPPGDPKCTAKAVRGLGLCPCPLSYRVPWGAPEGRGSSGPGAAGPGWFCDLSQHPAQQPGCGDLAGASLHDPCHSQAGREGWHWALLCRASGTQCSPNLSGSPGLGAHSTGAARVPWMALADGAGVPATLVPWQEGPADSRHLPAEDTPSCQSSGFGSWKAPRR